MLFSKTFISTFIVCISLLLNFCSASPFPQSLGNSYGSCHDGFRFVNGMCSPMNCPTTHMLYNGACILKPIHGIQPASCSSSCCQGNCGPPCQQGCQIQTAIKIPLPVQVPFPVQVPLPVPLPFPVPIPTPIPPPTPPPMCPPNCPPQHPLPTPSPPIPPPQTPTPQTPTPQTPPPQIPTPQTPLIPPPTPSVPFNCPNNTVLILNKCRVIYCRIGIYENGKCIAVQCPEGSIWNGKSCEVPQPHNHTTIILSTVVVTNNDNQSTANQDINYTNNVDIDIKQPASDVSQSSFSPNIFIPPQPRPQVHIISAPPASVRIIPQPPPPPQIIHVPVPQPAPRPLTPQITFIHGPPVPPPQVPVIPVPPPATPTCCMITTPNTCLWEDRYVCRSHSYQQCGPVCLNGNLNLVPPVQILRQPPETCMNSDCGYNRQPFYPDCSRCITGEFNSQSYCQTYCPNRSCASCETFDLTRYCDRYPEATACRPEYGYTLKSDYESDDGWIRRLKSNLVLT